MSTNSKLNRLKQQRDKLRGEIQQLLNRGKFMQANTAIAKVQKLDEAIEEAEAAIPRALAELFDKKTLNETGINVAMVKTYLAADFLADCAYDLKDKFNKLGVEEQNLIPILDDIKMPVLCVTLSSRGYLILLSRTKSSLTQCTKLPKSISKTILQ